MPQKAPNLIAFENPRQRPPDLNRGDGGGTFPHMEPASKEYVDLKLEAAMSRIEAKLESIRENQISPWQVWGAALTGFGAVLAVLAFGGDQFGLGSSLADQRLEQLERDRSQTEAIKVQNEKIDATLSRIDALLASQATPAAPAPESPSE